MAKISIIIPVYNSEYYLEKCLDSIFCQTFDDFEVIIVNDGSPDDSQTIIDRYQEKYPEKVVALRQENAGQASARNNGLSVASGEFIFFVDSDDYLHPDALKTAYDHAQTKGLDIVCFNFFQEENGVITPATYRVFDHEDVQIRYILNETAPWNKLIRAELLLRNRLRFSVGRIYEDLELVPQLALHTDKIGFLEDRLYYYVIHSGSTMRQKKYGPKLASIYSVLDTLKDKFYDAPYRRELEYLYIEHLLHGAVLRYLHYPEGVVDIQKISGIMKSTFPHWQCNPYYKTLGFKYKIVCILAYYRQIRLLKFLLGVKDE